MTCLQLMQWDSFARGLMFGVAGCLLTYAAVAAFAGLKARNAALNEGANRDCPPDPEISNFLHNGAN